MDIYIDHSDFLDHYHQYIFGDRIIRFNKKLPIKLSRNPIGPTRHYQVSAHSPVIYKWTSGIVSLSIEFDSILNHVMQLDGIFCSLLCARMVNVLYPTSSKKLITRQPYFFHPQLRSGWTVNDSLYSVLKLAEKRQFSTIDITAFGQGEHDDFLDLLKQYPFRRPISIHLYHLEDDDFYELKKKMTQV